MRERALSGPCGRAVGLQAGLVLAAYNAPAEQHAMIPEFFDPTGFVEPLHVA
jgi:hypothetical protein